MSVLPRGSGPRQRVDLELDFLRSAPVQAIDAEEHDGARGEGNSDRRPRRVRIESTPQLEDQ